MVTKYELSLSRDYVPDWTVVDAVRELFQNALDQQSTVLGNDMYFAYHEDTQTLHIGNKLSVLEPSTLLLGNSSKRGDSDTIGQFGEGYKVATLVLLRESKKVTFYNFGRKEVWTTRFVKSRKYGAEILAFFVDKKFPWTSVPDSDLTITVEGITLEEYESIVESNLHLQYMLPSEYIECEKGQILLSEKHRGQIYVNGLYVCSHAPYHCGYNFRPDSLELDRDRKLVSDFMLQWLAGSMWACADDNPAIARRLAEMVASGAPDVRYINNSHGASQSDLISSAARLAHDRFSREHGTNAVPVASNVDMAGLSPKYKPVIVPEVMKTTIERSETYKKPEKEPEDLLHEELQKWLDKYASIINSDEAVQELQNMIEKEKEKYGKSEELPF